MKKIKITHIHTDFKFVDSSSRFEGDNFENTIILIDINKNEYDGKYKNTAYYFQSSQKALKTVIQICKNEDIVVMYNLDLFKSYITNRIPGNVIIIWRFFGFELYSRMQEYVFSDKTKEALRSSKSLSVNNIIKKGLRFLLTLYQLKTLEHVEFKKAAFDRSDYFLGISDTEYLFLKQNWERLPPFLQTSFNPYLNVNRIDRQKINQVIVGNSRSPYNNHLDVIELIKNTNKNRYYKYMFLFSYNYNIKYIRAVRKIAKEVQEITLIENFMPINEFNTLYAESNALIVNGYRQMAMGNIFAAFRNDLKVYLNENNVIFDWLKREGFVVFSTNSLLEDLKNNKLWLSKVDALYNQKNLIRFSAKYNLARFHNRLIEVVKEKNNKNYNPGRSK